MLVPFRELTLNCDKSIENGTLCNVNAVSKSGAFKSSFRTLSF